MDTRLEPHGVRMSPDTLPGHVMHAERFPANGTVHRIFGVTEIDVHQVLLQIKREIGPFPIFSQPRGKAIMLIDHQDRIVSFPRDLNHYF